MQFGLRTKVFFALFAVCVVGLVPLFFVFSEVQHSMLRREALAQTERLARAMTAALRGVDLSSASARDQALGELRTVTDATGLFIVREDGRTWSEADRAELGALMGGDALMALLRDPTAHTLTHAETGAEQLAAAAPILDLTGRSDVRNFLLVALPTAPFEQQRRLTDQMLALFGVLVFVLVFVTGHLLLTRIVVNPVRRMSREMERVQLGELSDRPLADALHRGAHAAEGDELDQLSAAYKRLTQRLRNYQVSMEIAVREQKEINRKLQTAQESLIRSEKLASVGVLTAGIAHEIGNPISVILGYTELLRSGRLTPEEHDEFTLQIHQATQRINTIIRDLLDFSRTSPDEKGAASSDPIAVLDRSVKLLGPQKRFRDVEVVREFPASCPPARIDDGRLEQVLVNLLLNAADAMEGKGKVTLRVAADEDAVRIEVSDEGHGIQKKDLNRIFDPFFTTKRPGLGTGLGLAITHQLVTSYGGQVEVASQPGRGTTFTLRFARADPQESTAA
jgi:signal transduction histidine kinase